MEKNMIKAILACDEAWGIGKDNDLPWPKNPADLKWFKESTLNSPVIMGRKTWESLPFKLPNRENIVVTTSDTLKGPDVVVDRRSLLKILPQVKHLNQEVWIIGGAKLVESMLGYIDEIHLSRINGIYDCDTFLPLTKIKTLFILENTKLTPELTIETWRKREAVS